MVDSGAMNPPSLPPIPAETFAARRRRASERLGGGVMVLPAAAVQRSSRDTEHPYAPDRELYYLTGWTEPDSVAVLVGGDDPELVLFVRERDPDLELWFGRRLGPEGAEEVVAPEACHPLSDLDDRLPELLDRGDRIYYRLGRDGAVERHVLGALARARSRGPRKGTGPRGIVDPGEVLDDLRLVKDALELDAIRRACAVTGEGHRAGARAIASGTGEWEVQAAIEAAFRVAGAEGPGFGTIVGGGHNACVLHYVRNGDVLRDGELVLIDAGAQVGLYSGDVTRTYPVSGELEGPGGDVYRLVDDARSAAIAVIRPGSTIAAVHEAALRVLVTGLVDLGVLEGDVDGLVEEEDHKPFVPHQTSHWLGLDVHDPGDYVRDGHPRPLEPGMVFTVEPGLYFRPDAGEDVPAGLHGIGVRIEDDVAVTEGGCEVLTSDVPTDPDAVEALLRG